MGINFFKWLKSQNGNPNTVELQCKELFDAVTEFRIRDLCFLICTNMVANAIGRCEFKTYDKNKEVFGKEYYCLNFEPNMNQNATEFLHKLIYQLYKNNEALIINAGKHNGISGLVVADAWKKLPFNPEKPNEYVDVVVGEEQYNKTFLEKDVLHIQLNQKNMYTVISGLYASYYRLISAAMRIYEWNKGQHWKVHISQMAQGDDGWAEKFQAMIEAQIKPFLESNGAVLPEFDGYLYEKIDTPTSEDTRDIKALIEDIFDFTARGFLIPAVLVNGKVEGTEDANIRFLTNCIDPICDQLQEEITRKRYGFSEWKKGNFVRVDSSSIIHFDLFANAANVEKLVGSGAYTINDVRRAANQSTINEPWADEHFMTRNIADMGEAARQLGAEEGGINRG